MNNSKAKWICASEDIGGISPSFVKNVTVEKRVRSATVRASAMGAYNFYVNGQKVGNAILAPGFTSYQSRVLYQTYDITDMLSIGENSLSILGGRAWAVGFFYHGEPADKSFADNISVIAEINIEYEDGARFVCVTDESWECYTSRLISSELFWGDTVDMNADIRFIGNAKLDTLPKPRLMPQQHGAITEQERISVKEVLTTPKGERVLDFGQNLVGYVEIRARGNKGDRIVLSHAEVLDSDGNFYKDNIRTAKNINTYIL